MLDFGKVLCEPEYLVLGIDQDVDAEQGALVGEDILAMPVLWRLLGHHCAVEAEGTALCHVRGLADIFCRPPPLYTLLVLALAERGLVGELVGECVGGLHGQIMLARARGQLAAPLERWQSGGGTVVIYSFEDGLGNLTLTRTPLVRSTLRACELNIRR